MNKYWLFTFGFWLFCLVGFIVNDSSAIINVGPRSVHQWRQADCASYAFNYYQNNQPFFKPQEHTLFGKDGHVVSEFPIIYYTAAQLYRVFGHQEWVLRSINFAFFLFGCTCLLWLGLDMFEHKWLALIPPVIVYTSPYMYYYAINYLPDVPAFSLALAGLFFIFRYFNRHKLYWAYLAGAAFGLAMLLKISAGIACVAVFLLCALYSFKRKPLHRKEHTLHLLFIILVIAVTNVAWVIFAKNYNQKYGNGLNLLGIFPIWDADKKEINDIFVDLNIYMAWNVMSRLTWIWFVALAILILANIKKVRPVLGMLTLLTILGSLAYCVLWFRAFNVHDYYLINPFMGLICIALVGCLVIDQSPRWWRIAFGVLFLPVLAVAGYRSFDEQHGRYSNPMCKVQNEAIFTAQPFIRKLGITRFAKIISVPDTGPNVNLYYLNQPGWAHLDSPNPDINYCISEGARYIVIVKEDYRHKSPYVEHLDSLLGEYNGIYVYTLKP